MDKKPIIKAIRRVLNLTGRFDWREHRYDLWIWNTGRCYMCSGEGISFGGGPNLHGLRVPEKDQNGVGDDIWYAYRCERCKGTGKRPNRLARKRKLRGAS